jgi:hypothetical protein
LPSQNVEPGSGPFDFQFVFRSNVESVFANINASPAVISNATIYQVASIAGGAAIGATTMLANTGGGNWAYTYSTVVGNYYAVEVEGTAPSGFNAPNALISGQVSPVPAPAVLGLVGIGLVGLGLARKARRA